MNDTYRTYLLSAAWAVTRARRLALSNYRCDACGTSDRVQVHHLTYERIFREDMEDLMSLCDLHHAAAEEMVAKRIIQRTGDVAFLAAQTLRYIAPKVAEPRSIKKQQNGAPLRSNAHGKELRAQLLTDAEFLRILKLPTRMEFKRAARRMFGKSTRYMVNAMILFKARQTVKRAGARKINLQERPAAPLSLCVKKNNELN